MSKAELESLIFKSKNLLTKKQSGVNQSPNPSIIKNGKHQLMSLLDNIIKLKSFSDTSLNESEWSDEENLMVNEEISFDSNEKPEPSNKLIKFDYQPEQLTKLKSIESWETNHTIESNYENSDHDSDDADEKYILHHVEPCRITKILTPSAFLKNQTKDDEISYKPTSVESEDNLKTLTISDEKIRNVTSDVTVHLQDQYFQAHKLVLFNKSSYFRELILQNDGKAFKSIDLDSQISISAFKVLYDYMYTGEIQVTHDDFQEIIEVSHKLGIKGAPHKMLEFLEKSFDITNVLLLYDYAENISDYDLKTKTNFLITSNFMQISEQLEFLKISLKSILRILDDDGIIVSSELDVFRTAIRWLAYDWERRKSHCIEVISKVRLILLSQEELLICSHEMERWGIMELEQMKDTMITLLSYKMGRQIGFHINLSNGFNFRRRNSMAEQIDNLIRINSSRENINIAKSTSQTSIISSSLLIKHNPSILLLGGSDFIQGFNKNEPQNYNLLGNSMHQYVLGENSWKNAGIMPHSWHHPGTAQSGYITYICGGCVPSDNLLARSPQATARTWCFNATDRKFQRLPDMTKARVHHIVLIWQEKIFAIGGINEYNEILDSIECYDPLIDKWRVIAKLPQGRLAMAACVYKDLFWICGGIIHSNKDQINGGIITDTVYAFNPKKNKWHKVKELKAPRAFASLSILNGRLVLVGGLEHNLRRGGITSSISDIDVYDTLKNEWQHLTDLFTPRHCCSAVVIGRFLYVLGGISSDGEALSSTEIIDSFHNNCPTFGINLPSKLAGMGSVILPSSNT